MVSNMFWATSKKKGRANMECNSLNERQQKLSQEVNPKATLKDGSGEGAGNGSTAEAGNRGTCVGSQNNILWRRKILLSLWKEM